jgi:outer membrane protein assembly factor BamB
MKRQSLLVATILILFLTFGILNKSIASTCSISPSSDMKWVFNTSTSDPVTSASVGPNKTIYVGSWLYLYAIDPNCNENWKVQVTDTSTTTYEPPFVTPPAVAPDGTIYVGVDYNLCAVSPSGQIKWKYTTTGYGTTAPAVGFNGTVYFGSHDNNVYAVNPDGTLKWKYNTGEIVTSEPSVAADGTIYFSSGDGYLYALEDKGSKGEKKWSVLTNDYGNGRPIIGSDGTVYMAVDHIVKENGVTIIEEYYVKAFDPITGNEKWSYTLSDSSHGAVIGLDGTDEVIYAADISGKVTAIKANGGAKIWELALTFKPIAYPAVGWNNKVYVPGDDGKLHIINPNGTPYLSIPVGPSTYFSAPTIDINGAIYIGNLYGKLYAITTTLPGAAHTSWPMYRQGLRHIGSVEGGAIKWAFEITGTAAFSSPAVGKNGIIFITSIDHNNNDGYLYAVKPDGTLKWKKKYEDGGYGHLSIADDGTIYAGASDQYLYAFWPDGKLRWKSLIWGDSRYPPAISSDSMIYLVSEVGGSESKSDNLRAIRPDGSQYWTWGLGNGYPGVAIGPDEKIYASYKSGQSPLLSAYLPDSKKEWQSKIIEYPAPPVIGPDGSVYLTDFIGNIFSFDFLSGNQKWMTQFTDDHFHNQPAIGPDGTLYVGTNNSFIFGTYNYLYALDANGTFIWKYKIHQTNSTPAIGKDGSIYIADSSGHLTALFSSSFYKWKVDLGQFCTPGGCSYGSNPVIVDDGTLYAGGEDCLYAIKTFSGGLSTSSWPMYAQNPQHTSNYGSATWELAYSQTLETESDLSLLRAYRDNVLIRDQEGKKIEKILYKHSQEVLSIMLSNPDLLARAQELFYLNKRAVIDTLENSEGALYNTTDILDFILDFAEESSPKLSDDLLKIHEKILKKYNKRNSFIGFSLN